MKSKTSFFSPAIYKKNMSRFWPLWAFAIFFAIIIPIGHLIRVNNIRQYGADNFMLSNMLPTKDAFCYAIVDYIPSLAFIYALCVSQTTSLIICVQSVLLRTTMLSFFGSGTRLETM